ncbi:hypothetical protein A6R68_24225, partial [Neotoma lepida]
MTVSADKDGLGVIVRSIIHGGAISRDGRIAVGDCILSINEESTINLTNAQARAMLRRHSLIGPDIKIAVYLDFAVLVSKAIAVFRVFIQCNIL